jgi:aspartate kinase
MAVIVQKYGGTSVANAERLKHVAGRVALARDRGDDVVVVVSAMGDSTDELVSLAAQITSHPGRREMDALLSTGEMVSSTLLAMALKEKGYPAVSLSGAQAGIQTTRAHSRARILKIEAKRIFKEIEQGNIVIVAGFQGITENMDISTLGRGGSDTTAVALAVAVKAKLCEIYTDVDGVYTADPRLIAEASKLDEIGYEETLEMTSFGARVLHPRAVELAEFYKMPVLVASSFDDRPGTLIHGEVTMEVRNKARSIAHEVDLAKITVVGVPDKPGIAARIFTALAKAGVSVDTIVQNASLSGSTDLSFTVYQHALERAMKVVQPIAEEVGAKDQLSDESLGKVSVIGTGMLGNPGYAARMFSSLAEAGINIELISTSEIRITCLIDRKQVKEAVRVLHRTFELETGK